MSFPGAGWHPGTITMGTPSTTIGFGALMAFHDAAYGIFYNAGIATLYKVLASASSPTGYAWFLLPSFVTYDASTLTPSIALDGTTIIFTENLGSHVYALRVLKRSGDAITLSGSQQTVSGGTFSYGSEHSVVRVSDTTFARSYVYATSTSAAILGCSVSGATIGVESTSILTAADVPTGVMSGGSGAASLANIYHYGDGVLVGSSEADPFFGGVLVTGLMFTVGGGVSGTAATQYPGSENFLYYAGREGSADTIWFTSFLFVGDFAVAWTGSGFSFSAAVYPTIFPQGNGGDAVVLEGTSGYHTVSSQSGGLVEVSTTTQSGTATTLSGLTDKITSAMTGYSSMNVVAAARHAGDIAAVALYTGSTVIPGAFAF